MARLKNFRLQKVLEVKEHLESMGKLELHKARSKQVEAEKEMYRLLKTKDDLLLQTEEQFDRQDRVDLNDLKLRFSYLDQLQHSIEHINQTVQDLKKEVEQKRKELNSAVQERKIIQTLKDQFKDRQKQEIKKAENGAIDEIAIRKKSDANQEGA